MKRLLLGLVLALALVAKARAGEAILCDRVTVAGICQGANGDVVAPDYWYDTSTFHKITMTIFAVDPTTGNPDPCSTDVTVACTTGVSTSTAVLEFKECETCPTTRFPKTTDTPITNVSGTGGESYSLPPQTLKVRWNILTLSAGRLKAVVRFERGGTP